jgi:hypothetical protein
MLRSTQLYCFSKLSNSDEPTILPSRIALAERVGGAGLRHAQALLEEAQRSEAAGVRGLGHWAAGALGGGAMGAGVGALFRRAPAASLAGAAIGAVGGGVMQSRASNSMLRQRVERANANAAAAARALDNMRAGVVRPDGSYDESALDRLPVLALTAEENARFEASKRALIRDSAVYGGAAASPVLATVGAALGAGGAPLPGFTRGRTALIGAALGAGVGAAMGAESVSRATRNMLNHWDRTPVASFGDLSDALARALHEQVIPK